MSKTHIITLYFSELFYDARNKTYLVARGADMPYKQEAYAQLTEDEAEKEQFNRSVSTAFAKCVEALYPYTKEAVEDGDETTNKLSHDTIYEIALLLPDDMSKTSISLVTNYLHDYIVCYALYDWYSLTSAGGGDDWLLRANAALEQVRTRLNARINRVRRKLTPF